jgi:MFS family permease
LPFRLTGLWRNPDFLKLWAGQTVSVFGSLMGALQLTAILVLNATPFQISVLAAANVAPALVAGLAAGAWVDRWRRRPVLIGADLGRALLLASIPVAHVLGWLRIEQLWAVAFFNGLLAVFFDVAYRAYLPSLVQRDQLVEANSKLSASESVVEVGAFSLGGWIAQLLSAVAAVVIDAASFLWSAAMLLWIRRPEPRSAPVAPGRSLRQDIVDGLAIVWRERHLRALAVNSLALGLAYGMIGATITLFGIRELHIQPGVLGTIYAVGGVSSFAGALVAGRVTRAIGFGRAVVLGSLAYGLVGLLTPAARGPVAVASLFLIGQQLSDGAATIAHVNQMSLRQAITPASHLGRVNGSMRFLEMAMTLVGSLLAGVLAEAAGLRVALLVGACAIIVGAVSLGLSPIWGLKTPPAQIVD